MASKPQISLETRMRKAAEAALAHHQYVSTIDIFVGMGVLKPTQVEDWRRGRVPYLERVILGSLGKISRTMKAFQKWAMRCQLNPRETVYLTWGKGSKRVLQFSKSNHSHIERAYRTHFVSPMLAEMKKQKRKIAGQNLENECERTQDTV